MDAILDEAFKEGFKEGALKNARAMFQGYLATRYPDRPSSLDEQIGKIDSLARAQALQSIIFADKPIDEIARGVAESFKPKRRARSGDNRADVKKR